MHAIVPTNSAPPALLSFGDLLRQYIFSGLSPASIEVYQHTYRAWQAFAAAIPMNDHTIQVIVDATVRKANALAKFEEREPIGHVSPHDLRRTHIIFALQNGANLGDMQAQAGHSRGDTTMLYYQTGDAMERRERIEFPVHWERPPAAGGRARACGAGPARGRLTLDGYSAVAGLRAGNDLLCV